MTQKLCGWTAAPNTSTGVSPVKAGSLWNCLSKTIWATPRRRIEAPIVMMISVTAEAPRAGSIASRWRRSPTTTAVPMAISAASGQRYACGRGEHRDHAAEHDELALGEVHDVGSVVDQREAERDERVDRSDGQSGKEELQELAIHRSPRPIRQGSSLRVGSRGRQGPEQAPGDEPPQEVRSGASRPSRRP